MQDSLNVPSDKSPQRRKSRSQKLFESFNKGKGTKDPTPDPTRRRASSVNTTLSPNPNTAKRAKFQQRERPSTVRAVATVREKKRERPTISLNITSVPSPNLSPLPEKRANTNLDFKDEKNAPVKEKKNKSANTSCSGDDDIVFTKPTNVFKNKSSNLNTVGKNLTKNKTMMTQEGFLCKLERGQDQNPSYTPGNLDK